MQLGPRRQLFGAERQPVGRQVVDHALMALQNMLPVPRALGFRRRQSSQDGWAALTELFSDAPGASERRAALDEAMAKTIITDGLVAANEAQAQALWRIRDSISESQKREGASIKHNISVPVASMAAALT